MTIAGYTVPPRGFEVRLSHVLPYQQTYKASDVETKEAVLVVSDEWVHAYKVDKVLFVSKQLMEQIKQQIPT